MKSSTDIVTSCRRSVVASLLLRIFPGVHSSTRKMAKKEKVGTDMISLLGGDEFWGSSNSGSLPMSLLVVDEEVLSRLSRRYQLLFQVLGDVLQD